MKKLKERIYIKQWLDLKPYKNQVPTDSYYLRLCNEVKQALITNERSSVLQEFLYKDEIDVLACFLTSYFEDVISETNIWNSFIRIHKRLYGKQLPFYELDEYYEEEVNYQDISFLIWYFINSNQQENFMSPFDDFILDASTIVTDIFENAWEYAPENEFLRSFYFIAETETDFFIARNLIDTLLFKTYLFFPDTLLVLRSNEFKIFEKSKNDEKLVKFLIENRDTTLFTTHTRLLGLKGQEWIAEILGEDHYLSKDFLNISRKLSGYFLYKGQDEENIFLEHVSSGRKFKVTKKSFSRLESLEKIDTVILMGIVRWRNEWWFSGISLHTEVNQDFIIKEKQSRESKMAVSFLDHDSPEMHEILEKQYKAFKKFNNGMQIAFMDSEKIGSFLDDYHEFFNDSLELTDEEKEEAKRKEKENGLFGNKFKTENFSKVSDSGLVFFNPKGGVEIALAVNSAFPMKNNPFYNEDESEEHITRLLVSAELSTELTMYCVNNFKPELPFFKSITGKFYLDNLDFLLRFWKRGNYYAKPSIFLLRENKE